MGVRLGLWVLFSNKPQPTPAKHRNLSPNNAQNPSLTPAYDVNKDNNAGLTPEYSPSNNHLLQNTQHFPGQLLAVVMMGMGKAIVFKIVVQDLVVL